MGGVFMKLVKKLTKEVIWDFLKDNAKAAVSFLIVYIVTIGLSLFKKISTITLKINIPFLLFIFITNVLLIYLVVLTRKKYMGIKQEIEAYKNPENSNVKKFKQGDIVILRSKKDMPVPEKLSVYKISKSEIICRNSQSKLTSYTPEELLTSEETNIVFMRIERARQQAEEENQRFWQGINNW